MTSTARFAQTSIRARETHSMSQRVLGRSCPRSALLCTGARSVANRSTNAVQVRSMSNAQLDAGRENRERVVILGSGWAGYTLARQLDSKKYQAVVVSPRSHFSFTPLLASTSVGTLEFRTALEPIRSRRTNVQFYQGWADGVDFANKKVTIEESVVDPLQSLAPTGDRHAGQTAVQRAENQQREAKKGRLFDLAYDKLVISVGCYSQTFGTPGVKEHAYFLKDVGDARKIRNRLLSCFEAAALPTTPDAIKKNLLNFAIVGGGPTGIEFAAELHDLISEDLARIYPELIPFHKITVYDVSPKVLPMFDESLAKYAMDAFRREGITIKTSHHVEGLKRGAPGNSPDSHADYACYTLKVKEEGEVGVGMCVWSTGLMQNPFVASALHELPQLPNCAKQIQTEPRQVAAPSQLWKVKMDTKTGSILTDDRLQIKLISEAGKDTQETVMQDVYAMGDCAIIEGTAYPATAQVASQKAFWLAKRLNKQDLETSTFSWSNLGTMAYLGNWKALFQGGHGGNISGRAAWVMWRGAYMTKSVSIRNKILIPVYWFINWLFGRDISRF